MARTIGRVRHWRQGAVGIAFTLAACVALAACSSSPAAPATHAASHHAAATATPTVDYGKAAEQLLQEEAAEQWGPAYAHLATQQQALITKDHFESCAEQVVDGPNGSPGKISVVKTYSDPGAIPGTSVTNAPFEAVTLKLGDGSEQTVHILNDAGTWRWALSDPQDYANGQCPSS